MNPLSLRTDVEDIITKNGEIIKIQLHTATFSGADYDDGFITKSGSAYWCMASIQPIRTNTGGIDKKYLQEGKIKLEDVRIYVAGSVTLDETAKIFTGSPTATEVYSVIPNGIENWTISGTSVYKKIFARHLNTGSFINEY